MEQDLKKQIAVALHYDEEKRNVPEVSAVGKGFIAQKILDLAFASGVKVRQDADLAEILAAVDLNMEIPPAAFTAVAEILSYIYQVNSFEQ